MRRSAPRRRRPRSSIPLPHSYSPETDTSTRQQSDTPTPYETLRDAYEDEKRVTVTETDGTVREECVVEDFTHVRTDRFEVWRFVLRDLHGETTLFGSDIQSAELLD